jgi:hypothetical protein
MIRRDVVDGGEEVAWRLVPNGCVLAWDGTDF